MFVLKILVIAMVILLALFILGLLICAIAAFMLSSSLSQAEEKWEREWYRKKQNNLHFKEEEPDHDSD
jgi:lipopolysaccharide export LptBFGC system permease protein LptF